MRKRDDDSRRRLSIIHATVVRVRDSAVEPDGRKVCTRNSAKQLRPLPRGFNYPLEHESENSMISGSIGAPSFQLTRMFSFV